MFSLVFGSTLEAISAVITYFMFGLALGSYLGGRYYYKINRPLRVYAILEALIGISAVILYYLIVSGAGFSRYLHISFGEISIIPDILLYVTAFFLVAVPTTMMGATYSVISRLFVKDFSTTGKGIATVYGANTAGAVAGAFVGGFFLIPLLGMRNSIFFAALLNILICLTILLHHGFSFALNEAPSTSKNSVKGDFIKDKTVIVFLLVFAAAGYASMAYEVAWTRLLTMVIGNSVYAFSSILTVFLAGIALGSFIISRYVDRIRMLYLTFFLLELGIFSSVLVLLYFADSLPVFFLELFKAIDPSFFNMEVVVFVVVIVVVLIPTILMGAVFPVFNRILISRWGKVGLGVGSAYSANTLGGIFGALVAGFYYIPYFGVQQSLLLTAGINLFIGIAIITFSPYITQFIKSVTVLIFGVFFAYYSVWVPQWNDKIMNLGVYVYAEWYKYADEEFHMPFREFAEERELLFFEESKGATVAITKTENISLQINGKTDAGTTRDDMITQTMLSLLPLAMHDDPKKLAIIGLGSGVSLGAAEGFPLKEIDCIEILPAVVRANKYFAGINHNALDDKRVKLLIEDGRKYLSYTENRYDVIVSEPSNPWISGMSNLFTKEFFSIARDRLHEDGIMSQWLQLYSLSTEHLKTILNTFSGVFPHTSVWLFGGGDLILIGRKKTGTIDSGSFRHLFKMSRVKRDLDAIDFRSPQDLLDGFLIDDERVRFFSAGADGNTDDHPVIEFEMPKALYSATASNNIKALSECC